MLNLVGGQRLGWNCNNIINDYKTEKPNTKTTQQYLFKSKNIEINMSKKQPQLQPECDAKAQNG